MSPKPEGIRAMLNISFKGGGSEMTTNLGKLDRIFRLVLGIIFLATPFVSSPVVFASSAAIVIFIVAGTVMVRTSLTKFCPL